MQPRYEPQGVEERWQEAWESEGLYNADPDPSRQSFAIAHPPPNVTGDLHLGHALQLVARRHDRSDAADAGLQRPLPAGLRPRRHLDPERGREAPRGRGEDAPGSRPRSVRGARLGVAARVRRQDHGAVPAHRRVARLPPRAVHDGRGLRARGDALLRPPVEQGLDLPRQPNRQLVPVPSDLAVRSRGGTRRRGRRAHLRPLSVRRGRRVRDDRDRQAGDDPRRRRGRGSPGGRALRVSRRAARDRSLGRAARAGDRRRACRDGFRHGCVEDHARPRSEGLRDRPRPRAARAHRDRSRRPDDRRKPASSRA